MTCSGNYYFGTQPLRLCPRCAPLCGPLPTFPLPFHYLPVFMVSSSSTSMWVTTVSTCGGIDSFGTQSLRFCPQCPTRGGPHPLLPPPFPSIPFHYLPVFMVSSSSTSMWVMTVSTCGGIDSFGTQSLRFCPQCPTRGGPHPLLPPPFPSIPFQSLWPHPRHHLYESRQP
jgi:hypothetical protein